MLHKLGTVCASNYIYLNPMVTMIGAVLLLGEQVTVVALVGSALILTGVFIAEKK